MLNAHGGIHRSVIDPWVGLLAFAAWLVAAPPTRAAMPEPSFACPGDMRLVEGLHHEHVAHVCLDEVAHVDSPASVDKGKSRSAEVLHCYNFVEGLSILEGPATPIRTCMDKFEAPNEKGVRPKVMASYRSAASWCGKRGKRVCSEREWELACEGPEHRPLAYGWSVDRNACNSNKPWRPVDFDRFVGSFDIALREAEKLWQGTPSGRYATCTSPFGVFDMNGNVEEWVTSRDGRAWPGSLMGGFWAKPWTGCRGTNDAHAPTFAFYETGFRCCKDPNDARKESPGPSTEGRAPNETREKR